MVPLLHRDGEDRSAAGGYLRRKYRKDRRPTLPIENPWVFYPRYAAGVVRKHFKMAQSAWRFHWFKKRLERDPAARNYTDVALTPDTEESAELLEVLSAHTAALVMPGASHAQAKAASAAP